MERVKKMATLGMTIKLTLTNDYHVQGSCILLVHFVLLKQISIHGCMQPTFMEWGQLIDKYP
jgi:hypothetical protein